MSCRPFGCIHLVRSLYTTFQDAGLLFQFRPPRRFFLGARVPFEEWNKQVPVPARAAALHCPPAFVRAEHRATQIHAPTVWLAVLRMPIECKTRTPIRYDRWFSLTCPRIDTVLPILAASVASIIKPPCSWPRHLCRIRASQSSRFDREAPCSASGFQSRSVHMGH